MKKIIVLMSIYNGELYLEEQLRSIINQKFTEDEYEVQILVRDDGSSDKTIPILEKYREKGLLDYYTGKNMGFPKSFWHLLKNADDADYYAFADCDDVWFEDKLARAVERLSREGGGGGPLLYCSDVVITDKYLHPVEGCTLHPRMVLPNFPYTLTEDNEVQGCTCVFNRAAKNCMQEFDMERDRVIAHDRLAGQIVSLFGRVIYDENPGMFYRVHGNNAVVGSLLESARLSKREFFIKRIRLFLSNWERLGNRSARCIEEVYQDKITDNVKACCLYEVAHYRESISARISFLKDRKFRTGEFKHDIKLFIKILVGKI